MTKIDRKDYPQYWVQLTLPNGSKELIFDKERFAKVIGRRGQVAAHVFENIDDLKSNPPPWFSRSIENQKKIDRYTKFLQDRFGIDVKALEDASNHTTRRERL